MAKLTTGMTMPDFTFETPFETGRTLSETVQRVQGKTALAFLRYYGCTLCQYDIHQFKTQYDRIAATGGQLLVVFQSDPAKLAAQLQPGDLPFDIICDPQQKLYRQFDIAAAKSKLGMVDLKTIKKLGKAKAFQHGDYEGDELQLPALFVVESDRKLTHVHYGKSAGDIAGPEGVAELLK